MTLKFLQQNAQKSELAQVEIVIKLDRISEHNDYIALIQEPFKPKEKIACKPVGACAFPAKHFELGPRVAIFALPITESGRNDEVHY